MITYSLRWCRGSVKYYSSFININMGGVSSPIPVGYKKLLEDSYGEDFMIPKKDKSSCFRDGIGVNEWEKNKKDEVKKKGEK